MYPWIDVKDRVPEMTIKKGNINKSEQVLCAIKAVTQKEARYIVKEGCYQNGYWRIPGSQNDVVAWMPMPEYVGPQIKI